MTNTPDTPDQDEVDLCKGCNTMKHVDTNGLCGRCQPDQVDALDEILMQFNWDVGGVNNPTNSLRKAKAKLSVLLLDARIDERKMVSFHPDDLVYNEANQDRIKELEKQRKATE